MNLASLYEWARFSVGDAERWVNDTDPGSWVGHWLQGYAYLMGGFFGTKALGGGESPAFFAGAYSVTTCFAPREIGNLWAYAREHGWRAALRSKGLDGWMDFMSPYMGMGAAILTLTGGFSGLLAGAVASAIVIAMVAYATRNNPERK